MNETDFQEQFALCLDNSGYEVSIDLGKLYQIVADEQANLHGYVRVIDESGDDYAYDKDRFYLLTY